MSIEDNKKIVEHYFELMNTADDKAMTALLSEDFLFESMLQKPKQFNFTWPREHFVTASRMMSEQMVKPLKIWIKDMTAEGEKVAVEAESYGEMKSGKIYNNVYHFLFKIRDGKIYNVREYSCSYTANDCFGDFSGTFE